MKRLVLFSFYDSEGIADEYVYYLLKELKTIATKLVVIVNGKICAEHEIRMREMADLLIQRENTGYDAGAYKDAMIHHLGIDFVREYDELVLCNDTFYGPLVPFERIFTLFDKEVDFWGLYLWQAEYLSWLSSFFLVFRKRILSDERFYQYWERYINDDGKNINEVYATFETGLFYELCEMGYQYDVYAKKGTYHLMKSPDHALEKSDVLFLKKKAFAPEFYTRENACNALVKIRDNYDYDMNMIYQNVKRKYGLEIDEEDFGSEYITKEFHTVFSEYKATNLDELKEFCEERREEAIYIYGAGVVASKIYFLLRKHIHKFAGFVVSGGGETHSIFGFDVCEYDEAIHKDKAMIVALGPVFSEEVREKIGSNDNTVYIWGRNNTEV